MVLHAIATDGHLPTFVPGWVSRYVGCRELTATTEHSPSSMNDKKTSLYGACPALMPTRTSRTSGICLDESAGSVPQRSGELQRAGRALPLPGPQEVVCSASMASFNRSSTSSSAASQDGTDMKSGEGTAVRSPIISQWEGSYFVASRKVALISQSQRRRYAIDSVSCNSFAFILVSH